jgi:hypothetical protein
MKFHIARLLAVIAAMGLLLVGISGTANAGVTKTPTVTYTGQGLIADGFGGYDLNTEICDGNLNGVLENGADAEGPYLLFVLTATGATSATITIGGVTYPMVKTSNGTFKYVSAYMDTSNLPVITATYVGKVTNAQLTISHGCRPFVGHGAWCSPGFWMNADDNAWALTGRSRSDLFNSTVVSSFYANAYSTFRIGTGPSATFITDPTLQNVLDNPGGVNSTVAGPFGLNQFNATGAFLTDNIPGFDFSLDLFTQAQATGETDEMCPIDHHGDFKSVS